MGRWAGEGVLVAYMGEHLIAVCAIWSLLHQHSAQKRPSAPRHPAAGASKPHHLVDANGVVLGYSHFGMLAAARWIKAQTRGQLEAALADNPGGCAPVGHAVGGNGGARACGPLRVQSWRFPLLLSKHFYSAVPYLTPNICCLRRPCRPCCPCRLPAAHHRALAGRRHRSAAHNDAAGGRCVPAWPALAGS
jgi:hypothetical protein